MVQIDYAHDRCKGCHYCIDVCPKKVISLSGELNDKGYETVKFDTSGCIACGSCYTVCPDYAITIIKREG